MTVLWDGTASRPWGRMLFAEDTVPVPAPQPVRLRPWGSHAQALRALRGRYGDQVFTADQIGREAGLSPEETASAIKGLVIAGDLIRCPKQPMRRREYQWR